MNLAQALLFGALQGLTEFLPVSSSGHLAMARALLGLAEIPVLFDILLHVATLLAILIVFRRTVVTLLAAVYRFIVRRPAEGDPGSLRLILMIILATAVTGVVGVGLSVLEVQEHPRAVSVLFIVTGLILIASRFFRLGGRDMKETRLSQAVACGLAQGIGVLPGISRSGITISAAIAVGMRRDHAGEFSFLLSVPAIVAALLLEVRQSAHLMTMVSPLILVGGVVSAFIVGLASLYLLLRLIRRGRLYLFSMYLIPLGIVGLVLV